MDPPRPRLQPAALPYSSAITARAGTPRTSACPCSRYVATAASSGANAAITAVQTASSPIARCRKPRNSPPDKARRTSPRNAVPVIICLSSASRPCADEWSLAGAVISRHFRALEISASGKPSSRALQQPAHDLAAARLGQIFTESDLLGRHRRAQPASRRGRRSSLRNASLSA